MSKIESFIQDDNNKLDAYLIINGANRYYFTGYESTAGFLLLSRYGCYFVTDPRYSEEAQESIKGVTVETSKTSASFFEIIKDLIARLSIKTLGYENDTVLHCEYEQLLTLGVEIVPASEAISNSRQVKTEEEIGYIQKACSIADSSIGELMRKFKAGVTEKEMSAELEYIMCKNGGEGTSFSTICAFGENTSKPHAHPSERKLAKGDLITVDFGCRYHGYCSDMTRTFAYDSVSPELKKIYDTVFEAQKYAMSSIKPGMFSKQADAFAREYIISRGYDIPHSVGHGVGIEIHEAPFISPKSDTVLRENMVFSCEPGIYVSGLGGVRIEDLAVLRADGLHALTTTPKELIVL